MPALDQYTNISELRRRAKRRLPSPMFHYIDGGADDEWSLAHNTRAFDNYLLHHRGLRDISRIDLGTEVLGSKLTMPLILSPTGMSRLFHHHRELGVARAAQQQGVMYTLSTMATTSIEDLALKTSGPRMFQVYIFKDRELTRELVQRSRQSAFQALCLTVDTALAGNRERDLKYGMTMPPRINRYNFFSYATSLSWLVNLILNPEFKLANVAHRVDALGSGAMGLIDYVNSQFDRSITWDDAAWLAELWQGPLVIKGISHPDDARMAREIGASAIMISNHGGRQLDSAPAPIDCIAPIRDAVGDDLELIVDGGIRRGTHILKALALGANACSFGRPYLYGLAAAGQAGVERVITLFRQELERSLALMGHTSVHTLSSNDLAALNGPKA